MKSQKILIAFFNAKNKNRNKNRNKNKSKENAKEKTYIIKYRILQTLLLTILSIVYVYVLAIDSIPTSTILFEGEELNIKKIFGIKLVNKNSEYKAILTSGELREEKNEVPDLKNNQNNMVKSSRENDTKKIGTTNLEVKLFDTFNVKNIDVSVIERTKVIPVGQVSGLKLYTSGVLVVGMSEIKGIDNEKYKPYENSGIQEGDTIVEIENREIIDTKELVQTVNESKGKQIKIKYVRNGSTIECSITPIKTSETEYKLGLWVRDSAAGIGTMTYYEPTTKNFAALGHGITDIDTGKLLDISNGQFITTKVLSVIRGENGAPGKIQGSINEQVKIGTINKNSIFGIYGTVDDASRIKMNMAKEVDVATRNEIQLGEATMLCSLDGENVKEYKIQIEKIYLNNDYDNKSMFIRVMDDELIEKTGGIIQGMSGSPVLQNGKFIGAVTNVLINDPTKGYVVFGDLMVKEMRSVSK